MKLKEYVDGLVEFLKSNPELSDSVVIYSSDDEGNSYQEVSYEPEVQFTNSVDSHYFDILHEDDIEDDDVENLIKVVCIN